MDKTLGFTRKSVKTSGFLTRSEGAMGTRDCMERRSDLFYESPAFFLRLSLGWFLRFDSASDHNIKRSLNY